MVQHISNFEHTKSRTTSVELQGVISWYLRESSILALCAGNLPATARLLITKGPLATVAFPKTCQWQWLDRIALYNVIRLQRHTLAIVSLLLWACLCAICLYCYIKPHPVRPTSLCAWPPRRRASYKVSNTHAIHTKKYVHGSSCVIFCCGVVPVIGIHIFPCGLLHYHSSISQNSFAVFYMWCHIDA